MFCRSSVTSCASQTTASRPSSITPLRQVLLTRDYPGNVRDLRQLAGRIAYRHVGPGPVTIGELPEEERHVGASHLTGVATGSRRRFAARSRRASRCARSGRQPPTRPSLLRSARRREPAARGAPPRPDAARRFSCGRAAGRLPFARRRGLERDFLPPAAMDRPGWAVDHARNVLPPAHRCGVPPPPAGERRFRRARGVRPPATARAGDLRQLEAWM